MSVGLPLCGIVALLLAALASPGLAHEVRPGYLQLVEDGAAPGTFDALWRVPARGDATLAIRPRLPESCRTLGLPMARRDGARLEERRRVACPGGLAGATIAIDGLSRQSTDVLVRVEYAQGGSETLRATPSAPTVALTGPTSSAEVAGAYLTLGVEHILLGIDHLLFVSGLMLLISGWRRLVGTITAFTLAHSLTLAGATLGVVSAPAALVEALIALSIVFVAVEVVRAGRGIPGLATRWPWMIAFGFGLLHGFGFAGALAETGLPEHAIPLALLSFNIGVEVGQLLFVVVMLAAARAVALFVRSDSRLALVRPAAAYGIGPIAAFWTIERIAGFWLWPGRRRLIGRRVAQQDYVVGHRLPLSLD